MVTAPLIRSLADAASFDITVQPYLEQVKTIPLRFVDIVTSNTTASKPSALIDLYTSSNPLAFAFVISVILGAIFFLAAEITRDYSQVDRFWSVLPVVYILHYNVWARSNDVPTSKLDAAAAVYTLWGARLTFNFWRKGGYSKGGEDYRWAIIKARIGGVGMFVLNLTFISFMQSILLWLVTTPVYTLLNASRLQPQLTLADIIYLLVALGLLTIETIDDQQQWNFHQAKKLYLKAARVPANSPYTAEDLDRGFLVRGLWSWSRHPNFAAEQAIWITLHLWAANVAQTPVSWTLAGVVGYVLIFVGSTPLTEEISAGKYPEYKEYQKLVGRFVPGVLGGV